MHITDSKQSFKIQDVSTLQFSDGHVIHILFILQAGLR